MANKISLKKIPCVILAGGFGTRLSEETFNKPKPMIELGNLPILVHIIKFYISHVSIRQISIIKVSSSKICSMKGRVRNCCIIKN